MPGDVILGTPTGVIAIPPHLAEEVAESSGDTIARDRFGKLRLSERKYTGGEIDVSTWRQDIEADFAALEATAHRGGRPECTLMETRVPPQSFSKRAATGRSG
jgi:hypothetical protein